MQDANNIPPYEVYPYSIDRLKELLADKSAAGNGGLSIINAKFHTDYFEGYFSYHSIAAKTIVVENTYVDHDYLEDYAHYYVRCFSDYRRNCVRLHFFDVEFLEADLEKLLSCDESTIDAEILKNGYLGFVVVKPLPETIIGRTCLTTYNDDNSRRHYPITRDYESNLFGINLIVNSLAYQEQDSVVAVCATSALWTVFQGTGKLFHHSILSPVEITKAATERTTPETRTLTKTGLNPEQLSKAIRKVGLEPYLVSPGNSLVLASNVYAYLKAKIPLILGISLVDTSRTAGEPNLVGQHAVAITGFSMGHQKTMAAPLEPGGRDFILRASKIDKIYVHDDQIGPFARMELDEKEVCVNNGHSTAVRESMSSSWRGSDGVIGSTRAIAEIVLVPLYHKIRIPFEAILTTVYRFDGFIETLRTNKVVPLTSQLEWDIYLTTVNELKEDVFTSSHLSGTCQREVLLESMPKYLWRATAYNDEQPVLGLIFDATDIEQGQTFVRAIEYDGVLSSVLRSVTKVTDALTAYHNKPEWKIMTWFADQPD
ncbi:MAG TPA: hypothetical protein ENJ84_01585 [Gammaproteobacteria bacterium]|nr:hypothetical protein [Gammaproteobacteria bacterium]